MGPRLETEATVVEERAISWDTPSLSPGSCKHLGIHQYVLREGGSCLPGEARVTEIP